MYQPDGFVDQDKPDYMCKLTKALYGLKQALRAWFDTFSNFLIDFGFVCSTSDPSLFTYSRDNNFMVLLLYVDDILLIGNTVGILQKLVDALSERFSMKDMETPTYFLGIEMQTLPDGVFLHQTAYVKEILHAAAMSDCNPMPTPLPQRIEEMDTTLFEDPTYFRSLAGTATFGMYIKKSSDLTLMAYCDSDWSGCPETRRSTTGFCTILGSNLVSWSAKRQETVSRSSTEAEYRALA
ncbi:uncharacterized mitochondrial protein AtMg00810-like [Raphanus sativus]|uniref:Uncharacterized mitochondrial protein AtMg00810-like n=1 Tax=Raphanus sativus TaxID=3726 RepID=A0A6J0LZ77_RAPSA|nr:uncharacterized mitochondrial protein AtMg00810-like [Raphanus sativus]